MSLKIRVDDTIDNIVFLIKEYLEGFSESWLSNCSLNPTGFCFVFR